MGTSTLMRGFAIPVPPFAGVSDKLPVKSKLMALVLSPHHVVDDARIALDDPHDLA